MLILVLVCLLAASLFSLFGFDVVLFCWRVWLADCLLVALLWLVVLRLFCFVLVCVLYLFNDVAYLNCGCVYCFVVVLIVLRMILCYLGVDLWLLCYYLLVLMVCVLNICWFVWWLL